MKQNAYSEGHGQQQRALAGTAASLPRHTCATTWWNGLCARPLRHETVPVLGVNHSGREPKALEDRRIPADMVVDTGMGSCVIRHHAMGLGTEGQVALAVLNGRWANPIDLSAGVARPDWRRTRLGSVVATGRQADVRT